MSEPPIIFATLMLSRTQRGVTRLTRLTTLLLTCAVALLVGCGERAPLPPFHILLVSIDTLRADHLGCYGYERETSPRIDQFCREGVTFKSALAPRGSTWPSLTSLLTGKFPITHGVRRNGVPVAARHRILSQYLKEAGYICGAFLANFANGIASPSDSGFDRFFASNDGSRPSQHARDRAVTDAAMHWIESNRERRTFTWVHYMDPHRPYNPTPEAAAHMQLDYRGWLHDGVAVEELRKAVGEGRIDLTISELDDFLAAPYPNPRKAPSYRALIEHQGGRLTFDQLLDLIIVKEVDLGREDLDYINSRYDSEIRSTDAFVGQLFEHLERLDLAEKTLVVLTSDHGDELYDHNYYFFHAASVYEGVVHIPLILRWPGRVPQGAIVDRLVETVDILPTILDSLGLPTPSDVEGESLLPLMGHTGPYDKQYAFVELFHKDVSEERNLVPPFDGIYGVRDSRWKLIVNRSRLDPRTVPYKVFDDTGFHIGFEEVFDLQTDPGEEHNLLAAPDAEFRASAASALADASYRLEAGRARERLSAVLDTWLERHGDAASATPRFEMSQQVREQLEELGYAEDSPRLSEEPTVEGSTLEQLLSPVLELSARSDLNAAEQVQALLLEAEARLLLGDPIDAARTLRRAFDASPPRERADVETRAQELGLELPPGAGDT